MLSPYRVGPCGICLKSGNHMNMKLGDHITQSRGVHLDRTTHLFQRPRRPIDLLEKPCFILRWDIVKVAQALQAGNEDQPGVVCVVHQEDPVNGPVSNKHRVGFKTWVDLEGHWRSLKHGSTPVNRQQSLQKGNQQKGTNDAASNKGCLDQKLRECELLVVCFIENS